MRKIIPAALFVSLALPALPATAQVWSLRPAVRSEIRQDINQLDRQIDRAAQRGTISRREASGLRRQANDLRLLHVRYARNGLSRTEVASLERGINSVRTQLRLERRDWDGRRG